MFRVSQHPSSGVLKTVTAAYGTGHNTGTATSLQRDHIFGLQAQIFYVRHFRACNLYVYFFVTSTGLLIIVWFSFTWV